MQELKKKHPDIDLVKAFEKRCKKKRFIEIDFEKQTERNKSERPSIPSFF